jgi:hypothetical protein
MISWLVAPLTGFRWPKAARPEKAVVQAIFSGRERIELETLSRHFPVKRISGFKSAGEILQHLRPL